MFEKVPYGLKVRVRGSEQDGFVAEYAICTYRFLPFMDNWNIIKNYPSGSNTFPSLELAKEAAMKQYNSWIDFYKMCEEQTRITKAQRAVVWKHP